VRHDISSVSVAVHYDCILSWVSYMHIRYLISKWKLLYYVVHVSRARSIRIINLADSAVKKKDRVDREISYVATSINHVLY